MIELPLRWFLVVGAVWLAGWSLALAIVVWNLSTERPQPPPRQRALDLLDMSVGSFISWPLVVGAFMWFFILKRRWDPDESTVGPHDISSRARHAVACPTPRR